ncbi:hypothetical protein M3Y99_01554100 [Aphelenchoides fujianensis]|nr:hypothetical protein M3Y99_01554100 [Aphelenchoides fujianensis]
MDGTIVLSDGEDFEVPAQETQEAGGSKPIAERREEGGEQLPWARRLLLDGTCATGDRLEVSWSKDQLVNLRKFVLSFHTLPPASSWLVEHHGNLRKLVRLLVQLDAAWTDDQVRNLQKVARNFAANELDAILRREDEAAGFDDDPAAFFERVADSQMKAMGYAEHLEPLASTSDPHELSDQAFMDDSHLDYEYMPNFEVDMYDFEYEEYPPTASIDVPEPPVLGDAQNRAAAANTTPRSTRVSKAALETIFEPEAEEEDAPPAVGGAGALNRAFFDENAVDEAHVPFADGVEAAAGGAEDDEEYRTPEKIARIETADAYFSMKILKTDGVTPMPNYATMQEEELNDHLDKFGLRPMGRKRAIAQLTKIYEATHPVVEDPDRTPSRHRIYSQIRKLDEEAGNKRPAKKPRKGTQPAAPAALAAPVQRQPPAEEERASWPK